MSPSPLGRSWYHKLLQNWNANGEQTKPFGITIASPICFYLHQFIWVLNMVYFKLTTVRAVTAVAAAPPSPP
jgi:uncharacterized membrane protein YbaN (DUF454 family)